MSQGKFIARLCALVPPPGFHMTRYFGVFANRHHLRARIIPPSAIPQLTLGLVGAADDDDDDDAPASSPRPSRIGWAKLLARVFAIDVTICRKCGGRMRVLEVVDDSDDNVPNVVYTCGAIVHENHLVIPYAMSDYATTFATIELNELLSTMV